MFSQTCEYALRAVSILAAQAPDSMTTVQIATATKVPPAYLSKVLQALRRENVVKSQRGIGGGVSLTREPSEITVLDVVNAVDPIRRIKECPIGLAAHSAKLCPMHSKLDAALAMAEEVFRNTTLAEILSENADRTKVCKFPRVTLN